MLLMCFCQAPAVHFVGATKLVPVVCVCMNMHVVSSYPLVLLVSPLWTKPPFKYSTQILTGYPLGVATHSPNFLLSGDLSRNVLASFTGSSGGKTMKWYCKDLCRWFPALTGNSPGTVSQSHTLCVLSPMALETRGPTITNCLLNQNARRGRQGFHISSEEKKKLPFCSPPPKSISQSVGVRLWCVERQRKEEGGWGE